jgi:hypothetical protein
MLALGSNDYERITKKIYESYPNACVLWIEKVVNLDLEEKHLALFNSIKTRCENTTIKELFHGTNTLFIDSILKNGFKIVYNNRSAHGVGTYFSTDAIYSMMYSTGGDVCYMFLCDVIVGTVQQVHGPKYITADTGAGPPIYISHKKENVEEDRTVGPKTYVSPYDEGGIPRYLIALHKNIFNKM